MKLFSRLLLTSSICLMLSGCSYFLFGKSNAPKPVDRPKIENVTVTTSKVWSKSLGRGSKILQYALTPITDGRIIYALSTDGHFYRLNAQTGNTELSVKLGKDISAGLGIGQNALYAGTQNGDVIAINPSDGKVIWRTAVGAQVVAMPKFGDGLVIAKSIDGTITALESSDGTILWSYAVQQPDVQLNGSSSPFIGGGVIMDTDNNGNFIVLNEQNGIPLLNRRIAMGTSINPMANMVDQISSPQVMGSQLFGSSYNHMVYALDLQSGATSWQNKNLSTVRDIALSPNNLFITTPDSIVAALNASNGNKLWENNQLLGRKLSPPVALPGKVGVVDYKGYLYWLDSQNGQLLGDQRIGSTGAAATALVIDNMIVWQLNDGSIVAVRPN